MPARAQYDIWTIFGDSNCVGEDALQVPPDTSGGRSFQYKMDGTIAVANEPLDNPSAGATNVSFIVGFLRDYYAPTLPVGRSALVVTGCQAGTGVTEPGADIWQVGRNTGPTNYEGQVTRTNAAIALDSRNKFVGQLWAVGTNDIASEGGPCPGAGCTWGNAVVAMASDFRARVTGAANTPMLMVGMVPAWIDDAAAPPCGAMNCRQVMESYMRDFLPSVIPKFGWASPRLGNDLISTNSPGIGFHFTRESNRGPYGAPGPNSQRLWAAYLKTFVGGLIH